MDRVADSAPRRRRSRARLDLDSAMDTVAARVGCNPLAAGLVLGILQDEGMARIVEDRIVLTPHGYALALMVGIREG
jgi:hypothetical protein